MTRNQDKMVAPKFANPHSLSQDVERTTRSDIAQRAGLTSIAHDEVYHTLKRDLDTLLQDTWADAFAEASNLSRRARKHRNIADEDDQFGKDWFTEERWFFQASN